MSSLHLVLAVIALLIGIWLVCQHLKETRSSVLWIGVAIILLSLCHLVKLSPSGSISIAGGSGYL